jgi:WD40 repeat protein
VAFSPDGKLLATGSGDNTVKLWALSDEPSALSPAKTEPPSLAAESREPRAGKEIATFAGTHGPVQFSPDGKKVMTFSGTGRGRLWDLATKQEIRLPREVIDPWRIAPDGRTLVSFNWRDGGVRFWDIPARSAVISLKGHTPQQINCMAFSPDGRLLATGSNDDTVILWDVPEKRAVTTLRGHAGYVTGVAFSPDGRTLATSATDGAVKLWSLTIRQEVATLPERTPPFSTVTFSPDGNLLISHSAQSAPSTQTDDSVQLRRAASFAETDRPTRAAPRQPSR